MCAPAFDSLTPSTIECMFLRLYYFFFDTFLAEWPILVNNLPELVADTSPDPVKHEVASVKDV